MNLFRRKNMTPLLVVVDFLERELAGSGQLHGYRWMHHRCQQHGLNVNRETIRILLSILDPDGVDQRRRRRLVRRRYVTRGPNFVWHIDGWDKLKPFGVAVHGCIDGFSRSIIWLNAYYTNNNPRIIAGYYIEEVAKRNGCPRMIRADRGTENSVACHIQRYLRRHGVDAQVHNSFIYGTSVTNQRIESFWSIFKKHFGQFWIDLFGFLREEGHFCGDEVDKNLIRLCFMKMIQDELDKVCMEWNFHYIRRSRLHHRPFGRPFVMSMLPEVYRTRDYIYGVNQLNSMFAEENVNFVPHSLVTKTFFIYVASLLKSWT
ncbi:hypothetical protein BSL78_15097 [Apostichopus japonicus]|uniref:Integrase core domain-containing protein n=1 Tax=Stichopus japonicus TaxID=307972 RepID=A0A2G8KJ87_STIJA|nr:hypothetical protein BSL78_15097 [Apostichopus japonicus]